MHAALHHWPAILYLHSSHSYDCSGGTLAAQQQLGGSPAAVAWRQAGECGSGIRARATTGLQAAAVGIAVHAGWRPPFQTSCARPLCSGAPGDCSMDRRGGQQGSAAEQRWAGQAGALVALVRAGSRHTCRPARAATSNPQLSMGQPDVSVCWTQTHMCPRATQWTGRCWA